MRKQNICKYVYVGQSRLAPPYPVLSTLKFGGRSIFHFTSLYFLTSILNSYLCYSPLCMQIYICMHAYIPACIYIIFIIILEKYSLVCLKFLVSMQISWQSHYEVILLFTWLYHICARHCDRCWRKQKLADINPSSLRV